MSFYERLEGLLKLKKISRRKMLIDLGLVKDTMLNWRNRKNIPSGKVLLKLSEYLDVSVDYLLCNDKYCVSEDETLLLNEYRKLDKQQKQEVLTVIKTMAERRYTDE